MHTPTPYLDTHFSFERPGSLAEAGVLDARMAQVMGSASGHYHAHTVREHVQYFDCNLQFPEPLHIEKVLPGSLCIVQVFDGQWLHRVDRHENRYLSGKTHVLGLSEQMRATDTLPAGSHARMAGLRIAGHYLQALAEEDANLRPLFALLRDGMRFAAVDKCPALGRLLEQLYHCPYHGALQRLQRESLSLALLVELGVHLQGQPSGSVGQVRGQRDLAHEARRVLDEHLADPPTVLQLAQRLGVGETTLRRAFAQEFGQSMVQYLRRQRMELARLLVRQRKWQVAQIAYRLGYSHPANFNHAYKAYHGHPPGAEP